jgi:uncharacterized protein
MEHEDFSCTKCGRCCFGMGKYVRVIGQMGMNQVVVKHEIANETVYATIPRKYRDDFDFAEARSVTEGRRMVSIPVSYLILLHGSARTLRVAE